MAESTLSPSKGLRIWPLPYIGPPLSCVPGAGNRVEYGSTTKKKKCKYFNRIVNQNVATKSVDFSETIVFYSTHKTMLKIFLLLT
jgi:hypothetical protein